MEALKTTGRFQRSEDGQTWTEVSPETARRRLSYTYRDVQAVIGAMVEDGKEVRTEFAFYRFTR